MTHSLETMLLQSVQASRQSWQAGYDAGFEDGRRQALKALEALAEISVKIDALLPPAQTGEAAQ